MLVLKICIPRYLIRKEIKTNKISLEVNIKIWRENKEEQREYILKGKI